VEQQRRREDSPSLPGSSSVESLSQGSSERSLMANSKIDYFRHRFRLSSDEVLHGGSSLPLSILDLFMLIPSRSSPSNFHFPERWCMMQSKTSSLTTGTLYITNKGLYFTSNSVKISLSVSLSSSNYVVFFSLLRFF
jgi:hypothetical protein